MSCCSLLTVACSQHSAGILGEKISRLAVDVEVCASSFLLDNWSLLKSITVFLVADELHTVALGFTGVSSYVFCPKDYVVE